MGVFDDLGRAVFGAAQRRGWIAGPLVADPIMGDYGGIMRDDQQDADGAYLASSNAVYACVKLRADMLSGLPLTATVDDEPAENSAALALLHKPNAHWSLERLVQMIESSLCLWGEAFIYADRGESGTRPPSELWWLRSDRMRVVPDKETYIKGFIYSEGATDIAMRPDEVLWIRYANPLDEFRGLAPLSAARLAADVERHAMQSNRGIFEHGNTPPGVAMPPDGQTMPYTDKQMDDLERYFGKRLAGTDKRHRVALLSQRMDFEQLGWSPKDAEFVGAMGLSLEQVARAFGVPLYLLGIREGTTYANLGEARKAIWTQLLIPEAGLIAGELTRQLVPMFGAGEVLEFDAGDVQELQEDEADRWSRAKEQISAGALTINEWRESEGLEPLTWGDVAWLPGALLPVADGEPAPEPEAPSEPPPQDDQDERSAPAPTLSREVAFDSVEHRTLWSRAVEPLDDEEEIVAAAVRKLLERQRDSLMDRLKVRSITVADLAVAYQRARWIKEFRAGYRTFAQGSMLKGAAYALDQAPDDGGLTPSAIVKMNTARRFLERRAQGFATEVVGSTWRRLRAELSAGIEAGEGGRELAKRVESVMKTKIASSPATIARTEVLGSFNGSSIIAAAERGAEEKQWVTSLDSRVRDTHQGIHNEIRALDEDFSVGGPAPGNTGRASEDINCRCVVVYDYGIERSYKAKARDASEVTG